jgi:addiction module HigA family antidote
MPIKNPPHPGEIVKELCIDPLGLTITQAADALGVTRSTLSKVINGKTSLSPEMAIRLSKSFGSTPAFWLRLQLSYDLAQLEKRAKTIEVRQVMTPAPVT